VVIAAATVVAAVCARLQVTAVAADVPLPAMEAEVAVPRRAAAVDLRTEVVDPRMVAAVVVAAGMGGNLRWTASQRSSAA
jgi:hypothetical protein